MEMFPDGGGNRAACRLCAGRYAGVCQHEVGGHHGDIDLRYRLDEQQAHAWPLEHLLGDEAEGDDGAELQPGDGDDRHQGVLQRVAEVDRPAGEATGARELDRSEEHTSELQSLMRISYAVFCLKKKIIQKLVYICIFKSTNPT